MEDDIHEDASCVPPREERPNVVDSTMAQDEDNVLGQPIPAENIQSQQLSMTGVCKDSISMEGDIHEDASCVPPREERPNVVDSTMAQDEDNVLGQPIPAENIQSQQITDQENNSILSDVCKPHDYWSFNKLLLDISNALGTEDFNQMKAMFEDDVDDAFLERITSAQDLFTMMRRRRYLSSVNLLQLCALLHFVCRNDLLQSVANYSRETENALYLYLPSRIEVNGYIFLEFHVMGRDFTKTTIKELTNFKKIVCSMLGVTERFVIIDGVSPSSSITITLLLPELYATKLQNMLDNNEMDVIHLVVYGVDTVVIGDKKYTIQDVVYTPTDDKEQQQLDMYQQLQRLKRALLDTESENLKLHEEIENLKAIVMEQEAGKTDTNQLSQLEVKNISMPLPKECSCITIYERNGPFWQSSDTYPRHTMFI